VNRRNRADIRPMVPVAGNPLAFSHKNACLHECVSCQWLYEHFPSCEMESPRRRLCGPCEARFSQGTYPEADALEELDAEGADLSVTPTKPGVVWLGAPSGMEPL
jgi:hypothetical protein